MMERFAQYRLRFVIPLTVCLFFLTGTTFIIIKQINSARSLTISSLSSQLYNQIYRLQNNISDLLALNAEDIVKRRISEFCLDPGIKTFVIADETGTVSYSNFRELVGEPVIKIQSFDMQLAESIRSKNSGKLFLPERTKFEGYFTVTLGLQEKELRHEKKGIIYFIYDFAPLIAEAKNSAYKTGILFLMGGLLFAVLLSIVLHRMITHRVEQINNALDSFAKGNLDERLYFTGKDELGLLASGFNSMAQQIEHKNKTLLRKKFIIDHTADSVFLIKSDGTFDYINAAACKELGYTREELLTLHQGDVDAYYTPESWVQHWNTLKQTGNFIFESAHYTKDRNEIPVEIRANYFSFDGNEYICAFARNISDRKKAENELIQAKERAEASERNLQQKNEEYLAINEELNERNNEYASLNEEYATQNEELQLAIGKAVESDRLKTAFLQNMSHEIRTPMNAIMGFAQLLTENLDNKPKLEYFSEIIIQRCNDLLEIINDILDIARIESGQQPVNIESFNLNELFAELKSLFIQIQARMKKYHIFFDIQPHCNLNGQNIVTDKTKLKQIFINLLNNAFKYTEEGRIEGGCRTDENQRLVFYVSDTGLGIPSDKHRFVFERFSQLERDKLHTYGGTGLGLSIVKGFVELLGGKVWLESEPGKGSTFYFTMEYTLEPAPVVSEENDEETALLANKHPDKTILVVEDDKYNMSLISEMLSNQHLTILMAETAQEAIKIARSEVPDLILMDIGLPDMIGYEAIRQILQVQPHLKIIAQTAYAAPEDRNKALNSGCIDYISKPLKAKKLLSIIDTYL